MTEVSSATVHTFFRSSSFLLGVDSLAGATSPHFPLGTKKEKYLVVPKAALGPTKAGPKLPSATTIEKYLIVRNAALGPTKRAQGCVLQLQKCAKRSELLVSVR